ncbi:MAG: ATP-grasp domain-containing protein, partial [Acholeplasmataceae bacterium]|nr:ATP-grasp domain-containing protein [Acholeplasmataceae bacterium]
LKTRNGGYDGKGQYFIQNKVDQVLFNVPSILEAFIELKHEASIIVTRSIHGEIKMFPVIDNVHQSQRLIESSVPSILSENMIKQIQETGRKLVESLQIIGTLAIEFFITKNDEIYINECAPRVHNSGHLTIEACNVSQFEQHIRAICGLPLKDTTLKSMSLMANIYGQDMEASKVILIEKPEVHFHLYGKKEMKRNRKVGHVTVCVSNKRDLEIYRKYFKSLLNKENEK